MEQNHYWEANRFSTSQEIPSILWNPKVHYRNNNNNNNNNTLNSLRYATHEPIHGRTTYQPDMTTFLQPWHIPTQGYNITQSSAPDDGHMVARNMLSNY